MSKKIDMTGWKMWEHGVPDSCFIIIEEDIIKTKEKRNEKTYWKSQCKCGTIETIEGWRLRKGIKKQCKRCSLMKDMTGWKMKEHGVPGSKITVLSFSHKEPKIGLMWNCQCECGNIFIASGDNIRKGDTKSCGCLISYGEKIITDLLNQNNINYKKQYIFNNLIGKKGKLRFDFGILDNNNNLIKLIEFDGKQHFTGPEGNWKKSYTLEEIQYFDNQKNQYCKDNNILLQRISYLELNKITIKELLKGIEKYYEK